LNEIEGHNSRLKKTVSLQDFTAIET
jgi:hypothetical protein